jgi:hypothetical protein
VLSELGILAHFVLQINSWKQKSRERSVALNDAAHRWYYITSVASELDMSTESGFNKFGKICE